MCISGFFFFLKGKNLYVYDLLFVLEGIGMGFLTYELKKRELFGFVIKLKCLLGFFFLF